MYGPSIKTRAELDALAGRYEAGMVDASAVRIARMRACCAPLAVTAPNMAHEPDYCPRCLADARALNWRAA